MKLFNKVFIRLFLCIVVVLGIWAVCFFYAMMDEITDEVDDTLEDYSELIIRRSLAGENLPSNDSGSNNQYYITEVPQEYALARPAISYKDSMVYIIAKKETEPARMVTTIFQDSVGRYYQLEVSVPTVEKKDLKESIFYLIVALFAGLVLVVLIINYLVFKKTMAPLYELLRWLDSSRIGSGEKVPCVNTDTAEFRELNDAIAKYAGHSEELFEQQKQFIGNASHEVQTPIAICMNRVEMLMEDEAVTEKQMEELVKMHRTLEYVSRLNKSLLLLSKIDNSQFVEMSDVDFNELLKGFVEDYSEVYAYKDLDFSFEENGSFRAKLNGVLGNILATNLLKNACVHNIKGGKVEIRCAEDFVQIRNTASEGALDCNHIFERFYQGHKKEGSTGLGLAIADAICRQYGLVVSYSFEYRMHCFVLRKG